MAPAGRPGAKNGILERLESGEVVIGDGSFLISLEKRGYVKAGLWTPEAVIEHPDAVRQLHMEFLRVGSNVMQTFTFSASEDNMKWEDVNAAACDLAREVAGKGDALVAGGICQTSIYKYQKEEARIKKLFRQQLEVFAWKNVDFLIAEYFEHVEEAVWAVQGDMHDTTPGKCAVRLVKAGASIVGVNCRFGPETSLKTMELMKEGLERAGLKVHLMVQPLGFHTPDCGKEGFVDLPEYPFGLESRVATRWDIQKYAREAYNLGVRCLLNEFLPLFLFENTDMARRDYWENLLPVSGRPFCPSLSKPDI
uniref:Hcy-binding domain-containing protein n=1 Tax=Colobus angolensis palliatus TaxID=336983 RepID=A0A2K5JEA7_COLAP